MMAEMMLASWETIARRTLLIARDTCTPAEYRRMVIEKAAALQRSTNPNPGTWADVANLTRVEG